MRQRGEQALGRAPVSAGRDRHGSGGIFRRTPEPLLHSGRTCPYTGWNARLAIEDTDVMRSLPERIMEYAEAKPEATPIQAVDLLHLGNRATAARSLSRLARSERLQRICQGVYMRPIPTRFGIRAPRLVLALDALSKLWRRPPSARMKANAAEDRPPENWRYAGDVRGRSPWRESPGEDAVDLRGWGGRTARNAIKPNRCDGRNAVWHVLGTFRID